ncbi:MAG: Holliday junction branch migration protein RuvA [Alphaproteobacteria bacterium]|nr:Holliday junction branch migration protein RuvA [Alphaproteobacteria bacterium]MBV9062358.1 Holliday junction branch migration protein RuvA [Alphaproteobacteria bacterium]
MIGKLTGIVDSVAEDHVILDVGGVGYLVHCPNSTLSKLNMGATASLMTETKVGEDAIRLYGFSTAEEREWFRLLQGVQNVGARVALNVLSALSARELERAVALGDKAAVGRAQGIGPKLATRIVTELKDKAPAMMLRGRTEEGAAVPIIAPRGPEADAVAALVKLGYSQTQAAEAIARTSRELGDHVPLDALIRESLRAMVR